MLKLSLWSRAYLERGLKGGQGTEESWGGSGWACDAGDFLAPGLLASCTSTRFTLAGAGGGEWLPGCLAQEMSAQEGETCCPGEQAACGPSVTFVS